MSKFNEILEGLEDYYMEEAYMAEGVKDAIDGYLGAVNNFIEEKDYATVKTIEKYPFLGSFMEIQNCHYIYEGEIDENLLDQSGSMRYYDDEHFGRRYFVVSDDRRSIVEVPGKVDVHPEGLPDGFESPEPKTVGETITELSDKSPEFIISFFDDSDKNEAEMVIMKL